MKKGHRTVFQNAWSQKNQHSHWKNNSASKKLTNSYEKMAQKRLPKCLKQKKQALSLKKQFCFKKACKLIWKKATEPSSKMPEAKKTNTLIEKTSPLQKSLQIHMRKRRRTVFQNAWSQKDQHSPWKNNSVSKKPTNSYEKRAPEAKKTNTLIEKTILLQKSFQNHMKKGHRTVFQNAWSQKNQHSHWKNNSASKKLTNSYEKKAQNRLPKCLKPKNKHSHWKNNSVSIFLNSYEKRPQNRLPKCLKPKKTNAHWKNNSVSKKLIISYEKRAQNRLPKCLKPKKQTLPLKKNNSVSKKLSNSYQKIAQNRLPKCLKPKNQHSLWKSNSVSKKLLNSCEKRPQNRLPKCLKPKKQTLSLKKHRILPPDPPSSNSKKELKNWFLQLLARSWFCSMLFTIWILNKKVLKNWFFQLLARSWFSRMLFSIQFLIKKVLKNWFF